MSEIPFVNLLGEAIETAITPDATRSPEGSAFSPGHASRWRLRGAGVLRRHQRIGAVLLAIAIGGGAVAVAETLQSSTALVAGGIVCYGGTGTGGSMYAGVEANGRSPEAACADVFRSDGPAALGRPGVKLTACADPHGYVAVFEATGTADQCRAEGMSPLQAQSYALAQSSVDRLVQALNKLGANRTCIPPAVLVSDVQRTLRRLGWSGWQAELQKQASGSGACGLFVGTGGSFSDPMASLDASHHIVSITTGAIPSLLALSGPLDWKLLRASGRHCYTRASARRLVRDALASARVQVKFALTQEPRGGGWAYAQNAYERGCTIVVSVAPGRSGRTIDAWLNSKYGPPEGFGGGPQPSDFR
jgi:hypothetical protein